jgi:hypothetical protein
VFLHEGSRHVSRVISLSRVLRQQQSCRTRIREHIQNVVIQANQLRLAEDQEIVLERFGKEEALHAVCQRWWNLSNVVDGRIRNIGPARLFNALEHFPGDVLIYVVAGDAVEDKYGFDRLGSASTVNRRSHLWYQRSPT